MIEASELNGTETNTKAGVHKNIRNFKVKLQNRIKVMYMFGKYVKIQWLKKESCSALPKCIPDGK